MLKLLLFYNLAVITVIEIISLRSIGSLSGIIFPLLLLPLIYHFGLDLVYNPGHQRKKSLPVTLFNALTPKKPADSIEGEVLAGPAGISDRDRRLFLKLIGSTSLSLVFMALIGKRSAQAAFFGSMPGPGTVSLKDSAGTPIDPAEEHPTDGYKISQLDDTSSVTYAYYGFVNKNGNWYIQRETLSGLNAGDYRYFKGADSFSGNWEDRGTLEYDVFEDIF